MAVATELTDGRYHLTGSGGVGLDDVLRELRALGPSASAPSCCTWMCRSVVGDVLRGAGRPEELAFPDLEFGAVLAGRFTRRYLTVVGHVRAARPVPHGWRPLLDASRRSPTRLALAGAGTLLDYDLTLALVGACTVLGRVPGGRERAAHRRAAAVLGTCVRELVRRTGEPAATAAAARLDSPATRDAAWRWAERLWSLRGRPAEAEEARVDLDRAVGARAVHLLRDGR